MILERRPLSIDELEANHKIVSVPKCGFFLCQQGEAQVLLGTKIYRIAPFHLCIYTPNTFLQVLQKSPDLKGILIEEDIETLYPAISFMDIRKRLAIRNAPCLQLTEEQADRIARMTTLVQESTWKIASESASELIRSGYLQQKQYLLFALCLEIFNLYFTTASTQTSPPNREEVILNKFLVSVYKHCDRQRTVQFYADEQHLSPYYFSSIIKNRSGKIALQWIESVLMLFAKHYLECTDFSIKEIADKLHFPDQSTFGRYFKHHEGLSPSDFRKENRLSLFQPLEKSKTI